MVVFVMQEKKRKYEPPIPSRVGKRKRVRGPEAANKLPQGMHTYMHSILTLKELASTFFQW